MFNIGIDFGSTYTTVSAYRNETEKLETVVLGLGTPYIPTLVGGKAEQLEGLRYGSAAKGIMGRKGHVLYKAFKMLLTEKKSELLKERGYTEEITPAVVAEKFLTDLIQKVLEHYGEKEIDRVVIGAPEIWFKGVDSLSGRSILRNIFENMDCVKEVQVVSEPAAASAFFAYNYQTLRNETYDGHILLIDYGGGTLDITLSRVRERMPTENSLWRSMWQTAREPERTKTAGLEKPVSSIWKAFWRKRSGKPVFWKKMSRWNRTENFTRH